MNYQEDKHKKNLIKSTELLDFKQKDSVCRLDATETKHKLIIKDTSL